MTTDAWTTCWWTHGRTARPPAAVNAFNRTAGEVCCGDGTTITRDGIGEVLGVR